MAGIYIHFPFCRAKCIYCNFYSIANLKYKNDFIDALMKEIALRKEYLKSEIIHTLYLGGGTPSLFSITELSEIKKQLDYFFTLSPDLEFTIEANPDQLNLDYLKSLKELGINRLSIGIQSLNNHILKILRRSHTAEVALQSINNALKAGFENISVDLIYGIFEREDKEWSGELEKIFSYPISHLSAYSLTVEENTLLNKKIATKEYAYPTEEKAIRDFTLLLDAARNAGFEQYEISNFAKNGQFSRHNFSYWQGVPYLGLEIGRAHV